MLKVISTHIFLKQQLRGAHLDALASAGAEGIEIFCAREHFDYTERAHVAAIAEWFRSNPARPWALHAPLHTEADNQRGGAPAVNVVHAEKSTRIDSMDEIKRALETAEQIPFAHMILHLGGRNDSWSQRTLEHALTAVEHLHAFAKPLGVQVLLENLENGVAQPENLLELVETAHLNDVGFCLDVGHAHLGKGIGIAIDAMGPRIRSSHIHDNARDRDSHLWPGEGTIDWPETMQALAALAEPPGTVLEISSRAEEAGDALAERFRSAFELLETSAQSSQRE